MYYDDSSRRLNLLGGLVFGAALGAGLALLLIPDERLHSGRQVVVRAAQELGRTARGTLSDARDRVSGREARGAIGRAGRLARKRFRL